MSNNELVAVQTAVADFDRVAAGIAELQQRYAGVVYDVRTTKGMDDAREARATIREPRYEIERVRKAAKAPILALGKDIDERAKTITTAILAIEEPIDQQIKAEEARKEAEKQARINAEVARVARLQERVAYLRGNQTLTAASGSALIAEHISDLEAEVVDESFQEYEQQAHDAKAAGLLRLDKLLDAARAHEAEQERIRAERAELERLRAEQAKRDAEERARRAEEERALQAAREKEEAERRARVQAEEAERRQRIAAEEAELAARRAEVERQERESRERAEAEERARRAAADARANAEAEAQATRKTPTPREVLDLICSHFGVDRTTALDWLRAIVARQSA